MTAAFFQSLSNDDWLSWLAVCAAALLGVLLGAIATRESEEK